MSANGLPRHIEASQLLDYIKGEDCVIVDISFLLDEVGNLPDEATGDAPEGFRDALWTAMADGKKIYCIGSDEISDYIWIPTFVKTQNPRGSIIMLLVDDCYIYRVAIFKGNNYEVQRKIDTLNPSSGGGGVEVKDGAFEVKEMRIVDSEGLDSFVYVLPVTLVSTSEYSNYMGKIDPKYFDEMRDAMEKNKIIIVYLQEHQESSITTPYRLTLSSMWIEDVGEGHQNINAQLAFAYNVVSFGLTDEGDWQIVWGAQ